MATLADSSPARGAAVSRTLYPRAQYYFFAVMVVTWIGFARSYFLRLGEVSIYHHIHGAVAGLWIVSLIAQPVLYQRGLMRWHRRVGRAAAYVLAPAMVVMVAVVLHVMFSGATGTPPLARYLLGYLDLWALIQFPLFVYLAVRFRRNTALHARWMAGTVLLLLPPALVRALLLVPFLHGFPGALFAGFGIVDLIMLLLILDDRRYGKIRAPYPIMLAMFLVMEATMMQAPGWGWWRAAAEWWGRI